MTDNKSKISSIDSLAIN